MNWLQIALALLQLAPQVLQLITQVESVFGPGNGASKKSVVMDAVSAAGAPDSVTTKVSSMIDSHVAALNAAGKLLPHVTPGAH
jgi:hypothetical protein